MKIKDTIRFFKTYFKSEKKLFYKAFFLILISSLLGVLYGYLMGLAIDYAAATHFSYSLIVLGIYWLAGAIDHAFFNRLGGIYMERISIHMMEKISYEVYYKVGLLPARAFEEKSSGELINRITQDATTITETFKQMLQTVVSLWTALIVFIYICFNSWLIALEVILYIALFMFFSKKYLPIIRKKQQEITHERDQVVANVNETIRGIREIRALGIRTKTNKHIKNIITGIYKKTDEQMVREHNYHEWIRFLNNILECGTFVTCVLLIIHGKSTFAFFMAMTYYIYRFMGTVDFVVNLSTTYQKMRVSIERIQEIIENKLYQDEVFGKLHLTNIQGNICFNNITFRYAKDENIIFKNLNLDLPTGKKIAIVGESGQGKSSLFNLLLRYFKPNEGNILIDNYDIQDFDEETLRSNIAIIRQDPFLFNRTIKENFTILNDKITLKEIRKCCQLAEIDEYIMSLPKKYDTLIGEGGVNLSGGQMQRLAIARALLKNSKILLFDEATSALDNESQAKVKKAIDNLVRNHTIVIIAHRLSTIIDADIIHVIEKGKVAASGTHEELLNSSLTYQKLYQEEN